MRTFLTLLTWEPEPDMLAKLCRENSYSLRGVASLLRAPWSEMLVGALLSQVKLPRQSLRLHLQKGT